ncbi:MAG: beta-aspartyl-peptidase [Proteobacteria bacterium]|nr:beta-aspartyl-peptidase [Pseudomonadota bacterium]
MIKTRLVVHGGAGLSNPKNLPPHREQEAREALQTALNKGFVILEQGGSALDAVTASVCSMEDSTCFNAGKGSVLAANGEVFTDASIMCGKSLNAGSICGAQRVCNPIQAARLVMEKTPHVLLCGQDVEFLAHEHALKVADLEYFLTDYRKQQLAQAQKANRLLLDHESVDEGRPNEHKIGTVGAVALDQNGNIAAATSTGGMVNKRIGRVGDSALIGSGTYADNRFCAVSTTGHGEMFIRHHVASLLSSKIRFTQKSLHECAHWIIHHELPAQSGGLIAINANGDFVLPFNSGGMFRGYKIETGACQIDIWR